MPLIAPSDYRAPFLLGNGHLQTVYPSLFRRVKWVPYRRERMDTPDGDFLDLDWLSVGAARVAILSHGLEGNTQRAYMRGMARALNRAGWDVLAWNFRGCSGEPNRLLKSYHSGKSEDLHTVIEHVLRPKRYHSVALVGFSMGGNITLKYLGERGEGLAPEIQGAVTFSVPCDLASASEELARPGNQIYMRRFLKMLRQKIRDKMTLFPGQIDDDEFVHIRNFRDFDERYTAPLNGFAGAEDYWEKCSSRPFLPNIRIPALLVNARNDPFLSPRCYPEDIARENPCLYVEMPVSGGHVGFVQWNREGIYWSEQRAVQFLEEFMPAAKFRNRER